MAIAYAMSMKLMSTAHAAPGQGGPAPGGWEVAENQMGVIFTECNINKGLIWHRLGRQALAYSSQSHDMSLLSQNWNNFSAFICVCETVLHLFYKYMMQFSYPAACPCPCPWPGLPPSLPLTLPPGLPLTLLPCLPWSIMSFSAFLSNDLIFSLNWNPGLGYHKVPLVMFADPSFSLPLPLARWWAFLNFFSSLVVLETFSPWTLYVIVKPPEYK